MIDEVLWEQLLDLVDAGSVVPVVGRELLTFECDGQPCSLYPLLAEKLAERLGVQSGDLTPGLELNDIACRYLKKSGKLSPVYSSLNALLRDFDSFSAPAPLLQLAEIRSFGLFVTTSFDSFLTRALNQVRFGGESRTDVLSFKPGNRVDLPKEYQGARTLVFHLLGQAAITPAYAVTQWDFVEYFSSLPSETLRPTHLLERLEGHSMLILGSPFGGWLARFFLHIAKQSPKTGIPLSDFLADVSVAEDASLALFIEHLKRGTEVYDGGGAVQFVGELHRRWKRRHPDPSVSTRVPEKPAGPGTARVFLSYASEDVKIAERICGALQARQIPVFFDKTELQGGDLWEARLERAIRESFLFIPVMSRSCLVPEGRFFRNEWDIAIRSTPWKPWSERGFIIPVSIDDSDENTPGIRPELTRTQWLRLPGGESTAEFLDLINGIYRNYQKALQKGAGR